MLCSECRQEISASSVYCPHCGSHIEGTIECEDYTYEAFVSYRHLPADRAAAIKVQRSIEGTLIPGAIREKAGRRRFGKFFRDEDELSATASLSDTIENALKHSRYLIVICSPQTRESPWVMLEVETFASLHGRDRILVVLVQGEPEESFPPLLLSRHEPNEETGVYELVHAEPLAANLSPSNKANHKNEITRLKAALIGCEYDELQQRFRNRRLRRYAIGGVVAIVVSIAIALSAVAQSLFMRGSLYLAIRDKVGLVVREAQVTLAAGDRIEALEMTLDSLEEIQDKEMQRILAPETQMTLEQILGVVPQASVWESLYEINDADRIYDMRGDLQVVKGTGEYARVSRASTGAAVLEYDARPLIGTTNVALTGLTGVKLGEDTLLCRYGSELVCVSPLTGDRRWQARLPLAGGDLGTWGNGGMLYLEGSHQFVVLVLQADAADPSQILARCVPTLCFYEEGTGQLMQTVTLPSMPVGDDASLDVRDDEAVFALGMGNQVVAFDRNAVRGSADAMVVINSLQGSVWDVDFIQDRLLITSGSPADMSAEVSIECFDASMQRVWEATDSVYGVYATSTAAPVKAQVIDIVTDDVDTLVLATMGAFVNVYDMQDGSVTHVMQQSTPILAAGVMSIDDKQVIAGCTSTGSLFVSDLQAVEEVGETDSLRTLQLPYGIDDAHVIQGDEGLVGVAVWTSKPSSYRVFSPKTLLNPGSLQHKHDMSSTNLRVYQQVIVSTTGELIEGFDHNTFDKKWSVGLSSLGMMPTYDLSIYDRGSSVLVCGQAADAAEGLKVVELSCDDGTTKGQWVMDEEILSVSLADIAIMDVVSWEDGNRTMLFGTNHEGVIVNLDTRAVVSRFKAEREATLRKAWACGNSVITYQMIGVHGLFVAYETASGAKISGELARQSAYEVSGDLVVSPSNDRASIVVKCSDGIVRAYSTADCSLKWQSSSSTRRAQFVSYVSPTQVFLQDTSGMCTLLDAITGGVSQESDTRLPQIKSCTFDEDAQLVVATYENDGDVPRGLVAITLTDGRFGPVSLVRHGLAISEDRKQVLCYLPWLEDYVVYPRYGIDELIERGHEELATFKVAS